MKREKSSDILAEICTEANIRQSITAVLRGSHRKKTKEGRRIIENIDKVTARLIHEISTGSFKISGFTEMHVVEGGKPRTVQSVPLYDRIGVHAIMTVIENHVKRRYIHTTAASIKGRGVHFLLRRIVEDLAADPEGMRYIYESDVKKFYESVCQDFMLYALRRFFKGKILLTMLERFVRLMPEGLSIGLMSSQCFGNLLLSLYVDHYLKDRKGVKHFYRYCDNMEAATATKREAWAIRDMVHNQVNAARLQVKGNDRVYPVTEGLDALGMVVYPDHIRLRKRNKKNAARKLHKLKSKRRRHEVMASLYGQCKHGNCKHLFFKLTGIKMDDFSKKSLSELGIKPGKRRVGKKRFFRCRRVNVSSLAGATICIIDFEPDITTKYTQREAATDPDKEGRYLVQAQVLKISPKQRAERSVNKGEVVKFFTGVEDNYDICDGLKEADQLGNNAVTVEEEKSGGFPMYIFV